MEIEIEDSTLELIQGDITNQNIDAIVNAANKRLAPGGGVAGAIHRAAGKGLYEECKELGGCETGEAKMTAGHELPAKHVIHTVGPVYSDSEEDPKMLASCYRESLKLAEENGLRSLSFPAISTGAFGYPMKEAAKIALKTVIEYLEKSTNLKLVRFVLFDEEALKIHEEVLKSLVEL